jgi:HD superfamily phosphodiesterase
VKDLAEINLAEDVLLDRIRTFIHTYQSDASFGHGCDHAERVCKLAQFICEKEDGDRTALGIAALLHDISCVSLASLKREIVVGDKGEEHRIFESYLSGTVDHAELSARIAENLLREMGLPHEKIEKISTIIREHDKPIKSSIEAKILNDADALDRCGATWVARAFQRISAFDKRFIIDAAIDRYLVSKGKHPRHTKTTQDIMEKRLAFQNKFIVQLKDKLELRS